MDKSDSVVTSPFEVALSLYLAMLAIGVASAVLVGGWLLVERLFGL